MSLASQAITEFLCSIFRLPHFENAIAQQSDVPSGNQFLLYENVKFSEYVDAKEMAQNYPLTTEANPVFLFPASADVLRPAPITYREFKAIDQNILSLTRLGI